MLDLIISTALKFDMQLIDENRLVNKPGFTPHRRSATIHAFDFESLDKSANERDRISLNIDDDTKIHSLISPQHGISKFHVEIPSTPEFSLKTPKSKAALNSLANDYIISPTATASIGRLSRINSRVAFANSIVRKTSIAKEDKSPTIDY